MNESEGYQISKISCYKQNQAEFQLDFTKIIFMEQIVEYPISGNNILDLSFTIVWISSAAIKVP